MNDLTDQIRIDRLLERLIETIQDDSDIRSRLVLALLPEEFLRLPQQVDSIEKLLAQTVQTQERLAAAVERLDKRQDEFAAEQAEIKQTQAQLIETQNKILKRQEEFAAEIAEIKQTQAQLIETQNKILKRQEEFAAEIAEIKKNQREFAAAIERLTETQNKLIETVDQILKRQEEFAAEQAEMKQKQEEFAAEQAEMKASIKQLEDDVGRLKGDNLEYKLHFRLLPHISQKLNIRRPKVMRSVARPSNGFIYEMDDAADNGILTPNQRLRILMTDMIVKGSIPKSSNVLWIAIEASFTIDIGDIDRAKETAGILKHLYKTETQAVAAGCEVSEHVSRYADKNGVAIMMIQY